MKKLVYIGVVVLTASGVGGAAHAQLSGHVGLVSLYKSRGVDQDGRDKNVRPALQGGLRYDGASGWYVGNWNSTGRFGRADVEIDVYAGYAGKLAHEVGYDVGYVHYLYPGESTWNSGDLYVGLSQGNASIYIYRGMRTHVNKKDMYYTLAYKHPLNARWSATVGLGYLDYGASGVRSKTDFSLGAEYALQEKVTLSLQWQGATRRGQVEDGSRDNRVVAGIRYDF